MERADVIRQLKARQDFWDGARYVTEEAFAPLMAVETGFLGDLIWHRWWLSIIIGFATWLFLVSYIGRRAEAAEDAHDRAAGEGRYWEDRTNAVK